MGRMVEVGTGPDGVAPSRMASVSACVNLPLHHKVQKFSSGTGSPGWSRKRGRKTVVVWFQSHNYTFPEVIATKIVIMTLIHQQSFHINYYSCD